jgi:signal transduction histidine kinase
MLGRRARVSKRLQAEWASLVVHDLLQPINAIVLRSDLLLQSDLNDRQRESIWQVRRMALRLASMVSDLNDASALEKRRIRMAFVRIDLGALMRELVDRTPGAGGRTWLRLPPDHPVFVQGDEQRLEQVMTNLLSNAIKYSAPGTEIGFELREDGKEAEVTVSNRGRGIPADELPLLFDKYMRSRTVTREGPKGLGLGLYIARGLVEAHRGRIWAESVPDQTTAFHFTIPLDESPVARSASPAETRRRQHARS